LHAVNTTVTPDANLHLSIYLVKMVDNAQVKIPIIQRQLFASNESRALLCDEVLYLEAGNQLVGITDFSDNSIVVTVSYRELTEIESSA
jgi:hypothetical protein